MTTPTPRTDAILEIASIEDRYIPLRDLSRQLERELAAREEELAREHSVLSADIRNLTEKVIPNIRAEARDALQFVERWANYHGVKPTCTAKAALSAIQHYPPIREITESYKDGKIPETRNPWEELSAATDRAEKAEAELARTQEAFESLTLQVSELELSRDAAVKDAERIDWIERTLFDKQWNAVIDSGSRTYWRICGPYRHVTAKMVGGTFRAAIDAAMKEWK